MTATRVVDRNAAAVRDPPIGNGGIIGADTLNCRRPIAVHVLNLAALPDQIAHAADRRRFATDRFHVGLGQRRCASKAGAHAAESRCAGNDDEQVRAQAFDLSANRFVGALPDRDHGNQRRDANEDTEHGQQGARDVARQRLRRSRGDHSRKTPCGMQRWG